MKLTKEQKEGKLDVYFDKKKKVKVYLGRGKL